jgi:hypothetical protein
VLRRITALRPDRDGVRTAWVAELDCGHDRHVRHRPPWESRPWVTTAEGRSSRIGTGIDCFKCDQSLPPDR